METQLMTWMVRTLVLSGLMAFGLDSIAGELQPVRQMPPLAPVPVVHQEFEPMPAQPKQGYPRPLPKQPYSYDVSSVPTLQEVAAQEAAERRRRIAARKWAGRSAGRPTVSPIPFFGAPTWHAQPPAVQLVPVIEPTLPPSLPETNYGYQYFDE